MPLDAGTTSADFESRLGGNRELDYDYGDKLRDGRVFRVSVGVIEIFTDPARSDPANSDERKEVLEFLAKDKSLQKMGSIVEKPDGRICIVKKSRASAAAGAVGDALSSVRKKVEKARRNDEQEIRAWGMVSWVRRTSENDPLLSRDDLEGRLKTEFKKDFEENEEDLDLFAKEAVNLARNATKNTESATRVVAKTDLAKEIAIRLGRADAEADIRAHFEADTNINTFKNKKGTVIHRAQAELKEILDIAFRQAKALRAEKAKEKAGSLNLKARQLGMVSAARTLLEEGGESEVFVKSFLTSEFAGETDLADLVDAALREAQNKAHNENAAKEVVHRLRLGAKVAARLAKGEDEVAIGHDLATTDPDFLSAVPGGSRDTRRSKKERKEMWDVALAEGKKIEAATKHNVPALIEEAHTNGYVVLARTRIENGDSPDDVEKAITSALSATRGDSKAIAKIVVQEALDGEKYKRRLDSYVRDEKLGEKVLRDRDAGLTDTAIEAQLRTDEESYKNTVGKKFKRSKADLDELVAAAFRQANALAEAKRKASHSKTKLRAIVPGSLEGTWEKKMTDLGVFRLVRLRREQSKKEDEIRTEIEALFAGEHDPEAMAVYAMEQAADAAFNKKQAENVVFLRNLDRTAKAHIDAGLPGTLEAKMRTDIEAILGAGVSNAEKNDIVRAAINRAESEEKWRERGVGLKKAAKYGAVGTAVLGLGTAATALVASAAALTLGWKGIKMVGRGIETAAAYGLPMMGEAARAGVNVAGATLKFARNTLLYAPASMIATPMVRTYQAARVAVNYPDQANYQKPEIKKPANKEAKGWTTPFTWMANGFRSTTTGVGNLFRRTATGTANFFRGGWRKTKQAGLLAAALLTAPVVGLGEGTAIGVGHHIAGAEWHGSETIDHFMEENGKPHATPAAAHAAPAANGNDHAKPHAKAH